MLYVVLAYNQQFAAIVTTASAIKSVNTTICQLLVQALDITSMRREVRLQYTQRHCCIHYCFYCNLFWYFALNVF